MITSQRSVKPERIKPTPPKPGKRTKERSLEAEFDRNGIYEIHVFAHKLGISRQDVNDRFRKAGLKATNVGTFAFITGEEFYRWLKENEREWGKQPNSTTED